MTCKLENTICYLHHRSHCILVGNATTGLVIALTALGLKKKRIAIPNSVCPHVPIAIFLSGNYPYYIDITMRNLGLDVRDLMRAGNQIDAVIAVHAYGSICDIVKIADYCKTYNLPLIEDLAVAQGATIDGRPVGSFSDIAVVSFGTGKIIDVSHGGAVITSNQYLVKEISAYASELKELLDSSQKIVQEFGTYHTSLYNEHYSNYSIGAHSSKFKSTAISSGEHMLCKFDERYRQTIQSRLDCIKKLIDYRRLNAHKLENMLDGHESKLMEIYRPPTGSVPWRFNILIEDRNRLLRKLLGKNMKVSSWFPSVDMYFKDRSLSGVYTPESDHLGERIMNLWVNEEICGDYLKAIKRELINHLNYLESNHS